MADSIIVQDATIDGKPVKLRASCDTCNESKVRCSHAKPRCARCERLRITCVYGLSRRSHKTAPRVGAISPSGPSDDFPAFTPIPSDQAQSDSLSFYAMFAHPSADCIDVWNNFDSALNQTYDMSAAAVGPVASLLSPESPSTASKSYQDSGDTLNTEHSDSGPGIDGTLCSCTCTADLVKQLQSMPSTFEDQGAFLDIHLSRLRDAINVSQTCINCNCITRDEMSIGKIVFYNLQISPRISILRAPCLGYIVRDIIVC